MENYKQRWWKKLPIDLTSDFYKIVKECLEETNKTINLEFVNKIESLYKIDNEGNYCHHNYVEWLDFIQEADVYYKLVCPEATYTKMLQVAIARHPHLINEAARVLLKSKNLYDDTIVEILKRNDFSIAVQKYAYEKVKPESIEKILETHNTKEQPLCDFAMNQIISNASEKLLSIGKVTSRSEELIFKHTNHEFYVNNLLVNCENIPENILTHIASNANLNPTIRDRAFDLGCDWEQIPNDAITYHMAYEMYPNVVIYPFEEYTKEMFENTKNFHSLTIFARRVMETSLEKGLLSNNQKIDFFNKVMKENPMVSSEVGELFSMMLIEEKEMGFFEDIAIKVADEHCSLVEKDYFCDCLLSNKTFHTTNLFEEFVELLCEDVFEFDYNNENKIARMNIILYRAKLSKAIQSVIANGALKFLEDFPITKNVDDEKTRKINEHFSEILINLIRSPHTSPSVIQKIKTSKPYMQTIETLRNIAITCHNQKDCDKNDIVYKVFCAIACDYMRDTFMIYDVGNTDYDLVLKILEEAKTMHTEHPIKHRRQINKLITTITRLKNEQFKIDARNNKIKLKGKVLDLCKKEFMLDFYIQLQGLQKEFEKIPNIS